MRMTHPCAPNKEEGRSSIFLFHASEYSLA